MLYAVPGKGAMLLDEDRRSREAKCWKAVNWHDQSAGCDYMMNCMAEVSREDVAGIVHCSDSRSDLSEGKSRSCNSSAGWVEESVSCMVEPPT